MSNVSMREMRSVIRSAVDWLDDAIKIESNELYHRGDTIATMGIAGGILRLLASYLEDPDTAQSAAAPARQGHPVGDPDWFALGEAVRERRNQLGLAQHDIAKRGGPSTQTMMRIENAHRTRYESRTLSRMELGLGWKPGTARAILEGRPYTTTEQE